VPDAVAQEEADGGRAENDREEEQTKLQAAEGKEDKARR
jgi:hypothetical protein